MHRKIDSWGKPFRKDRVEINKITGNGHGPFTFKVSDPVISVVFGMNIS